MDDLTFGTLCAVHDRLLKELNAHANGERSVQPTEAEVTALRSRLAVLRKLIAQHTGPVRTKPRR